MMFESLVWAVASGSLTAAAIIGAILGVQWLRARRDAPDQDAMERPVKCPLCGRGGL